MKEFILFEFKFTTVAVSLIKKFKFKKEEIKRKFLKKYAPQLLGKKQPEFLTKDFKYFKVISNFKIKYIVVAIITNYLT